MGIILLLMAVVWVGIAYRFYSGWIARTLGVNDQLPTPAHTMMDGVDYVPTKVPVLLGHHFASIAGAGPIVGPVIALAYGWLPVYLWILVGVVFIGAVHDFTSIFASIRHGGKSIGEIIENRLGRSGKRLFLAFSWATLILVVAVFTDIVAKTFVYNGSVATASVLFILLAFVFGIAIYRLKIPLGLATILGVFLLGVSIYFSLANPIQLSYTSWVAIISIYIFLASVLPVWVLLQPRDYLNSFILYAMMAGALVGIFFTHLHIQLSATETLNHRGLGPLFPILFITVACGAISGFHALVASGTTAKQLDKESDARKIGYGGMLIEGILAVISVIAGASLVRSEFWQMYESGQFIPIFATGVSRFMQSIPFLGITEHSGKTFISLAVAAFALTSLDTATRLARFMVQEFFDSEETTKISKALKNRYMATIITVSISVLLLASGSALKLWPLFGSANQLLAALALLAVTVWLSARKITSQFTLIPMLFMYLVTSITLMLLIKRYTFDDFRPPLAVISLLLLILSFFLAFRSYKKIREEGVKERQAVMEGRINR